MRMSDEYLFNLAHLYITLLQLMLCSLTAIKKPNIAAESKR